MSNKVEIRIGNNTFYVSTFCFKKVGDTENMKFRLECPTANHLNRDFDDYKGLENYINNFLWLDVMQLI